MAAARARVAAQAWGYASHTAQKSPPGDWTTWLFLGGRGAGKTRAGAEWVWEVAEGLGAGGRIALVGATLHDARSVMVEGASGVMNLPFRNGGGCGGARFEPSLRRVIFPGGAVGMLFSAEEPERLRGPQFHAAWGDEVCAWGRGAETLANLRLGLRLASGSAPRLMLSSTPKPSAMLRGLLGEAGLVRTDAATGVNAANLAPGFLAAMQALYGGTRRAAQELEGRVLEADGALFRHQEIERARILGGGYRPSGDLSPAMEAALANPWRGDCERVVVAVDPPAGTLSGRPRDACGIVVAGVAGFGEARRALVIDDRTARGLSPDGWAARVKATADAHGATLVVVEANQGGAMAEAVLRASGMTVPVKRVHAVLGKAARAEPVAALYEQGRVAHAGGLGALEEELLGLGAEGLGERSPDRADALVWAISELMLGRSEGPRARWL